MSGGACSAPVLKVASGLLACESTGPAFDGGSGVHEVVMGSTTVFVEGGFEEEGTLGGGVDGGTTVGVAMAELDHDGLESFVQAVLDGDGVGEEVQLDCAVVGDFDVKHRRRGCGDGDIVQ